MRKKDPFKKSEDERIKIGKEQEGEIESLYLEAYYELRERFKYYLNNDSKSAAAERRFAKQARKDLQEIMNIVDNKTSNTITNNTDRMVSVVLQNNRVYLNSYGYNSPMNIPEIKRDVVNSILNGDIYGGKFTLSSAIWGDNAAKLKEIDKIIAKGVMENQSVYDIAKNLERYVNPNARKGYLWDKMFPGSRKVVDYNAQRLARTMLQHAYQKAFVEATILNPFIDAYRWVTSGAHNVCALCIERETTDQFGLGEGIFPKDELPLDHPNGMCTFEVVVSMSDLDISDAIADWYLGIGDSEMNKRLDEFAESLERK